MQFGFRELGAGRRVWPVLVGLGLWTGACAVDDVGVKKDGGGGSAQGADGGDAGAARGGNPDGAGKANDGGNSAGSSTAGTDSGGASGGDSHSGGGVGGEPSVDEPGGAGGAGDVPIKQICKYFEQDDSGNAKADPITTGAVEATGEATADNVEICGTIDADHFDQGKQVVDIDTYTFEVSKAGGVRIATEFFGEVPSDNAELVIKPAGESERRVRINDDRGIFWGELPAGTVEVSVSVQNPEAFTAKIPYIIHAHADDLAQCQRVTKAMANGTELESSDGANNVGNDFLRPIIGQAEQVLTPDVTDKLEDATNFGGKAGYRYLLSGSMAKVTHAGSSYGDGDGWRIELGFTKQLTIRVDWNGANSDLDLWIFKEGDLKPIATALTRGKTQMEAVSFSGGSFEDYWIWVGSYGASPDLPMPYDVTICWEEFIP